MALVRSSLLTPHSSLWIARGPVFGVIPMLVVGPLALLAMLFPAVFGGLMLVLRRWTTALTVLSINSLLLFLQDWFNAYLITSWWGSPAALWLVMSLVTVCGALWAWRKHTARLAPMASPGAYATRLAGADRRGSPLRRNSPGAGRWRGRWSSFRRRRPAAFEPPQRGELIALGVLSLLFVVGAFFLPRSFDEFGVMAKAVVLFAAGVWAATLHACYLCWVVARRRAPRPGLPGEGVLLGAMLLVCRRPRLHDGARRPGRRGEGRRDHGRRARPGRRFTRLGDVHELFQPKPSSWIASPPRVVGDRIYVGAVHGEQYQSGSALLSEPRRPAP